MAKESLKIPERHPDTKEISRSRKYKKDGQCIGQEKDVKRTNKDLQNNLQNTKYWASRITQKHGC